jgi:hypothetical protein
MKWAPHHPLIHSLPAYPRSLLHAQGGRKWRSGRATRGVHGAALSLSKCGRPLVPHARCVDGHIPFRNGPLYGDFAELDAYINLVDGIVPKPVSVFSAWVPEGTTNYLHPNTDDLILFYDCYPPVPCWYGLGSRTV